MRQAVHTSDEFTTSRRALEGTVIYGCCVGRPSDIRVVQKEAKERLDLRETRMSETKKPSCSYCPIQNVCFMPKEIAKFKDNFKAISYRDRVGNFPTFAEVVIGFKEFIASNCRFYEEEP